LPYFANAGDESCQGDAFHQQSTINHGSPATAGRQRMPRIEEKTGLRLNTSTVSRLNFLISAVSFPRSDFSLNPQQFRLNLSVSVVSFPFSVLSSGRQQSDPGQCSRARGRGCCGYPSNDE
jgi:hypothetical protein